MHQPHYRDGIDGEYRLPWVYLHGLKDYTDMAAHFENNPNMRGVINFAPVLLEQIEDYVRQLALWRESGQPTFDPLLNYVIGATPIPADAESRVEIVRACQRCHHPLLIDPYPEFRNLVHWFDHLNLYYSEQHSPKEMQAYLDEQYFIDLLVWYHLVWFGHTLRKDELIRYLMDKGRHFSGSDMEQLAILIHDTLAGLIPRYRALAASGQIEISMTPYGHPIVPLLYDFENMRCALPDAPAPKTVSYPGGKERNRWHMQQGLELMERYLGVRPKGVWLSEGGVSDDAMDLLDEFDIAWTATGEGVWRNSCQKSGCTEDEVHSRRGLFSPYTHADNRVELFFRDDGLSDMIGFEYSNWHADDAIVDFIKHLRNIRTFLDEDSDKHVVSVILDGENAWEYYPDNGANFLDGLYKALADDPDINVMTFSGAVESDIETREMVKLCPGSWVYGSFSTWIGEKDKNRAWELLVEAKQAYDAVIGRKVLTPEEERLATQQLAVCEGSDWFWWFGDYNSQESVSDFEQLF
ncbi:MAG: glycoside hydrolase family 57 protein, partial [Sedimenticolaceae bacterium]|nr:glycoside hydrolase family 57 protein [Sedimenticolaceae bacterium]